MSTALTAKFAAQLTGQATSAAGGTLFSLSFPIDLPQLIATSFTNGTGALAANQIYIAQRTLTATSTEDINMYDFSGALDPVGNAITMAGIKLLIIQNTATVAADTLTIGNKATSAAWTSIFNDNEDRVKIRGGGSLILLAPDAAGYAVVNSTNHLLKILNDSASNSVTYNIIAIGDNA